MSKASLELGGGNWAAKDGKLLGYAVGDTSGKYLPREFTFSRGADIAATRVNKDGLIEKYRENLLLRSNQFDTSWTSNNTTETGGQAGYDGTSDGWLLAKTASDGETRQSVDAGLRTFSIYAKAGSLSWVYLLKGGNAGQYFNLGTGLLGSPTGVGGNVPLDAKIENVGGGWYRCSMTYNDLYAGSLRIYPADGDNDTSGTTGNIYIQDAQLEYGLVATDYLESDSTTGKAGVLDNLPRIDYTSGSAQLLMEPSRTNLVSLSEGIIAGSNAVTTTLNYGVAPDGTTSSLKVQKNGTTANERITIADDLAVLDASTYTVSGFVKNIDIVDAGVTTIGARVNAGTLFRQGYEWTGSSLATTSYASGGSTSNTILEDYGNGWWRIGFTFTTDGTQLDFEIDIDRQNAVHTTSIETWGWQLEAGSSATSYIPTYGAQDTKAGDDIDIFDTSGLGFGTTCSIYFEGIVNEPSSIFVRPITMYGSGIDLAERFLLFCQSFSGGTYTLTSRHYSGGGSKSVNKTGLTVGERVKCVSVFDGTSQKFFVNGSSAGTDTIPAAEIFEYLDLSYAASDQNHTIDTLQLYPVALSDAECIALTTL